MEKVLSYSVRELHIDLLLLEEFYSSSEFREWFVKRTLGERIIGVIIEAKHSVFELERESDLEMVFQDGESKFIFLVENKINAQFQKNQAMDYMNRGKDYVRRGLCDDFLTVLFAPHHYIQAIKNTHVFGQYISFEELIKFFELQNHLGDRALYKIQILKQAISKYRQTPSSGGYEPANVNTGITEFWQNYWKELKSHVPQLLMPQPGNKGPAATFIGLGSGQLPKNVFIYHKFVHGYVDFQFEKMKDQQQQLIDFLQDLAEEDMTVQRAGKAAVVVRIQVEKINPHLFFDSLIEKVHMAQEAAYRLLKWFNNNNIVEYLSKLEGLKN